MAREADDGGSEKRMIKRPTLATSVCEDRDKNGCPKQQGEGVTTKTSCVLTRELNGGPVHT